VAGERVVLGGEDEDGARPRLKRAGIEDEAAAGVEAAPEEADEGLSTDVEESLAHIGVVESDPAAGGGSASGGGTPKGAADEEEREQLDEGKEAAGTDLTQGVVLEDAAVGENDVCDAVGMSLEQDLGHPAPGRDANDGGPVNTLGVEGAQ
jgi:hypothetical protein